MSGIEILEDGESVDIPTGSTSKGDKEENNKTERTFGSRDHQRHFKDHMAGLSKHHGS